MLGLVVPPIAADPNGLSSQKSDHAITLYSASSLNDCETVDNTEKEKELIKKRFMWIYSLKALLAINVIWQVANIIAAVVKVNSGQSAEDLS